MSALRRAKCAVAVRARFFFGVDVQMRRTRRPGPPVKRKIRGSRRVCAGEDRKPRSSGINQLIYTNAVQAEVWRTVVVALGDGEAVVVGKGEEGERGEVSLATRDPKAGTSLV